MIVKPEHAERNDDGCVNKNRYPTRAFALKTLRAQKGIRSKRGGGRVDAYLCKACDSWHLGHDPKRRGRNVAGPR